MNNVANPWRRLPLQPPYVVSEDADAVRAFNSTANDRTVLRLELLPEPFLGNPNAQVVLLNLNPGFSPDDLIHHRDATFSARSRANLLHEPSDYPFYLLDPEITAPGRYWWDRKLRQLRERVGREAVARGVLCVEYFPYHSLKFGHDRLALPSQQYSFHLVRAALERGATICLMRSSRFWVRAVPELGDYSKLYRVRSVQTPAISAKNCPEFFEIAVRLLADGGAE